jgi:antitoxin component of RelBE/YafQ-DinJ toxin-antitoxin module
MLGDMDLTVSVDEEVLEKARHVASARGTSVDQLVREYLASLCNREGNEEAARRFMELVKGSTYSSEGRTFTREELHERR